MFIYLIVNRETGKYYVGQHKGDNLKKYLQQKFHHAQRGISSQSRLYRSMRAHPDPLVWSIHALRAGIQTRTELDETERDFITFLKAQNPEYGYNICRGGEGFTGPHSKASRKKTSESLKKAWKVPEIRKRITGNRRGKTHDRGCLIPHEARVRGAVPGVLLRARQRPNTARLLLALEGLLEGRLPMLPPEDAKGTGDVLAFLK